jgi:hypothetical protein
MDGHGGANPDVYARAYANIHGHANRHGNANSDVYARAYANDNPDAYVYTNAEPYGVCCGGCDDGECLCAPGARA